MIMPSMVCKKKKKVNKLINQNTSFNDAWGCGMRGACHPTPSCSNARRAANRREPAWILCLWCKAGNYRVSAAQTQNCWLWCADQETETHHFPRSDPPVGSASFSGRISWHQRSLMVRHCRVAFLSGCGSAGWTSMRIMIRALAKMTCLATRGADSLENDRRMWKSEGACLIHFHTYAPIRRSFFHLHGGEKTKENEREILGKGGIDDRWVDHR